MQVSEEDILEAERVAQETRQAMRSILKGIILILPALPFPQPPQGCVAPDCYVSLPNPTRASWEHPLPMLPTSTIVTTSDLGLKK